MGRPRLEVADIFGRHGAAWRRANAGHVSLGQLQVMSAIVSCRTAALGGHVTRCEDCAHTQIAYNSCRNRHCPKCQGAAARDWLAEREAELLPVPYFHVVFTLPAAIADIAYQNKAVIYDALFKASSETLLTIAADPKHLGARIGITAVLHTLGLGHDPSSAPAHDRARRRDLARRIEVGRVQAGLLPAGARALEALSQADAGEARRGACRRQAAVLRRARSSRRCRCLRRLPRAAQDDEVVRLRQEALRRTAGGARLSRALHPPRRHLEPPAGRPRRGRRHVPIQGLPPRTGRSDTGP